MRTEDTLRIANFSGAFGDRSSAAREMVEGGPIDFLTGDYLAELTMLILWKNRQRDPSTGYATTFLKQMEEVLGTCLDRNIRVVVNAGGLNPAGLASRLREVSETLGLAPNIAHIEGDDVLGSLDDLIARGHSLSNLDTGQLLSSAQVKPISANAYLGAWGIVDALQGGADVVICPRVTDASLVVGPAAWAFDWKVDDWDALAGAVAAGHVIECGTQATGGNYAFFEEIANPIHPGFPIAEVHRDGSSVISKHEGTAGQVSIGTVTSQLLYEIGAADYFNPDVVASFDTIQLEQLGPDRVLMSGAKGKPAPENLKVCINYMGGYRHTVKFFLTGLDIEAKAKFAESGFFDSLGGKDRFAEVDVRLIRSDHHNAKTNVEAVARLEITIKDPDEKKLGRPVFDAMIQNGLANYPGFFVDYDRTASSYGVYWPALLPASEVLHRVVHSDGSITTPLEPPRIGYEVTDSPPETKSHEGISGPTRTAPLGILFGARSGDKGGNANVGLWARNDASYDWLRDQLTVKEFRKLLPEADDLDITRSVLPGIRAVNFVVRGILGEGVASTTRPDNQAKGLGEFIRSKEVELPVSLLDDGSQG